MAETVVKGGGYGSSLGSSLTQLLMAEDIEPGDTPGYELCKTIYLGHPLGKKMIEAPITLAQSQARKISIPNSPESRVKEAFEREWKAIGADKHIFNTKRTSRIYGVGSIIYGALGVAPDEAIDPTKLADLDIYFNVLDPLNTAGSLVLNQDPNSPDFQKHVGIAVSGKKYHRSRSCTVMNGEPVYIAYTTSAFGYVGRSVYQPVLFPLKSFVQSMVTDDLVTLKAGLLIEKLKPAGSITDRLMAAAAGVKRNLLKLARTGNVLSISIDESIESLDLNNIDKSSEMARRHVLENIAAGDDMPAKLLNSETFAEGFGEGTEDAKQVARYVERLRNEMAPLYDFFDPIVMRRAWNPEFYKTVQAEFPDYEGVSYNEAFYRWKNSFTAEWPSLLIEPESERIKVDETKMKSIIAMLEVLLPQMDPENKALVIQWAQDNFNENKLLFTTPLAIDIEALKEYVPPATEASSAPTNPSEDMAFPDPGASAGAMPANGADTIQQVSLNGSQVTSMIEIVQQVAVGLLPRDSAAQMLMLSFRLDKRQANSVLGTVGKSFVPADMSEAAA